MSSALLSDLGFSPLSQVSNDAFEEEIVIGQADLEPADSLDSEVLATADISEQNQLVSIMPDLIDPLLDAEVERLEDIKDDVELSLIDMPVSRVTVENMEVIKQRISDTHSQAKEYAKGMIKLARKFPSLEESFKLQYASDGKSLLKTVSEQEDLLLSKMHGLSVNTDVPLQPTQQVPGVAQPGTVAPLPVAQAVDNGASVLAKAAVKYTRLLNLAMSAKQDAEEDGLYLDTVSDEKISRLVQKI